MKPWKTWLACFGVAGACVVWSGCSKNSTPKPDAEASTEEAAKDESSVDTASTEADSKEPAAKPAPSATAKADDKSKSGTNEMLALAGGTAGGEAGGEAAGGNGGAAPGFPGGGGGMPGPGMAGAGGGAGAGMMPGPGMAGAGGGAGAGMMPGPGMAGAGGGAGAGMMPGPGMAGGGGRGPNPGGAGMMPGPGGMMAGAGGAGGGSNPDEPSDLSTQRGGAAAFLNALRAKDPVRLREATARRAEEFNKGKRYEKLFKSILDESISQDEIEELAKVFEGFQIAGANQAKTTSTLGIILQKSNPKTGRLVYRTLTVRREKEGWKVLDLGHEISVTTPGSSNVPRRR
jgi:hypothetical protein